MATPIRVAVNGYGVIGKRVADAVRLQDDMVLAGVADVVTDYRVQAAAELAIPLFGATEDAVRAMREAGLAPAGTLDDLVAASDVVVDATPKKVAAQNRDRYLAAGRKAIFQGGEKHALTGFSFVASLNYADALGRDLVRVVSCNTTALGRVVGFLHRAGLVTATRAVLFRRGTDPWESHLNAPLNTIVPETSTPSHQGPDLQTILPDLDIVTMAAKGPFDLGHVHFTMVETTRATTVDEVRGLLEAAPRVAFVRAADGLVGQNSIVELMRDLGRPRADLWEVALWEDAIAVRPDGGEIYLVYHVPNEAIVIPETIDAIRAMTGLESDPLARSRRPTRRSASGVASSSRPRPRPRSRPLDDERKASHDRAAIQGAREPRPRPDRGRRDCRRSGDRASPRGASGRRPRVARQGRPAADRGLRSGRHQPARRRLDRPAGWLPGGVGSKMTRPSDSPEATMPVVINEGATFMLSDERGDQQERPPSVQVLSWTGYVGRGRFSDWYGERPARDWRPDLQR